MKGHTDNTKALYAVILAAILGGGLAVFAKIGLRVIPPFTFTFLRFVIGSLFLIPFLGKLHRLTVRKIAELMFFSLFSTVNMFLFAFGVRLTTATIAQLLYAFVPILVAILSMTLINKKPTGIQITGIVVGFGGVFFLVLKPIIENKILLSGSGLGNILIAIGAVLYSLYLIYSKKLQKRYSPSTITAAFIGTTLVASAIFAAFEYHQGIQWIYNIKPITYVSLLYVGILGTGIFYFLNQYAVKHGGPVVAAVIQYTIPPATLMWAMVLLNEKITPEIVIGGILAYFGAWLVMR